MSAFLLPCTCGRAIRVTTAQAGGMIVCPECGRDQAVPKLRDLARLERAGTSMPGTASRGDRPWTLFHTLLLAGTLLAAGFGLGSLTFIPPEVERFDADAIRDSVIRAPTSEVLAALRTRLVPTGIDRPPTDLEAKSQKRSDFYHRLRDGLRLAAMAGAALALLGGIGMLLGRRPSGERRERAS